MTIEILVIDDELGRIDYKRSEFLQRWNLFPESNFEQLIRFTFITSQRALPDRVENDPAIAAEYIQQSAESWALVMLDMQFDHGELLDGEPVEADPQFGLEIQRVLEQRWPLLPIVHFTAQRQVELQRQDSAYLSKLDGSPDDLRLALVARGRVSVEDKSRLLRVPPDTVLASEAMIKVYAEVYRRARADTPLLIRGETGTGKEHLAQYFHHISPHSQGPLVVVPINAIPANLYESQLFGHEKGSFTGADKTHLGHFTRADGGTIFLDEIGTLPPDLQAKLLRVLGERMYRRLGGDRDLELRCSVVAATQDNLESNGFREDLLARFATVTIPSLQERPEEIPALSDYFLAKSQERDQKRGMVMSEDAQTALQNAVFRNNARGLRAAIENAVLQLSSNSVIQPWHLGSGLVTGIASTPPQTNTPVIQAAPDPLISDRRRDSNDAPMQPPVLVDVVPLLEYARIPSDPDGLRGLLSMLDQASAKVRQELAYATLKLCRHPVTGKLKVQPAMQLLTGDAGLSGMNAQRTLNRLLGNNQSQALDLKQIELELARRNGVLLPRDLGVDAEEAHATQ